MEPIKYRGERDMAKKKQAIAPPPPEPAKAQISVINLKGTKSYRGWLVAESKRTHIPASSIVRLGLALWASQNGGKTPPEK